MHVQYMHRAYVYIYTHLCMYTKGSGLPSFRTSNPNLEHYDTNGSRKQLLPQRGSRWPAAYALSLCRGPKNWLLYTLIVSICVNYDIVLKYQSPVRKAQETHLESERKSHVPTFSAASVVSKDSNIP